MSTEAPSLPPEVAQSVEAGNAVDLALAPAFGLAQMYSATAHALGLQALTQQSAQQHAAISLNAVTLKVCAQLLSADISTLAPKA